MNAHLSAFRSFLAALPPRPSQKCGDTGDTRSQVTDLSANILYHRAERHGDTGDTASASALRAEGVVSPVSPAQAEGDTRKSTQNHRCATRITCITGKTSIDGQIAEWRATIERVSSELPDIVRLKEASLRFLDSPDAVTAVVNEWDAVSLFGMHAGEVPKERIDCWGLVLFLAWGVHAYSVDVLDQKVCAIRTRSGAVLQQPRRRANHDEALPWWEHPGLKLESEGEL
jgi:hypothetical protein